jgi:hypothetical protein
MNNPYDSFRTQTALHITNTFGNIIDHGTPRGVDDAFAALKGAAERIRQQVIEDVENIAVRRASHIGEDWNSIDGAQVEKKNVLQDHGASIQQLSWVLYYLSDLRKDQADPLTKDFAEKFGHLRPSDKFDNEKLAACYGAAVTTVAAAAPDPAADAAWNEPGILDVFHNFGFPAWEHISAQIAAMDTGARERLMAGCEYAFLNMIKLNADDIAADDLQGNLMLGKYLVAARGAAAEPLLKSYVETVSAMRIGKDDLFHQPEILAVAQTHAAALENHAKLKQLAEARKKRAAMAAAPR